MTVGPSPSSSVSYLSVCLSQPHLAGVPSEEDWSAGCSATSCAVASSRVWNRSTNRQSPYCRHETARTRQDATAAQGSHLTDLKMPEICTLIVQSPSPAPEAAETSCKQCVSGAGRSPAHNISVLHSCIIPSTVDKEAELIPAPAASRLSVSTEY